VASGTLPAGESKASRLSRWPRKMGKLNLTGRAILFQKRAGRRTRCRSRLIRRTQRVTVTLSVEDPDGYFIPNLRPENSPFTRTVSCKRARRSTSNTAAVSLSVLLEGGGRYQELNQLLSTEIPFVARPLLSSLIPDDKVAVSHMRTRFKLLADVDQARSRLDLLFTELQISGFSEANLYDALVETLNRTRSMPGAKRCS